MKTYKVSTEGGLKEQSPVQCQLEFYSLSENRSHYYLENTLTLADINTTKLYQSFQSQNEVFFFSMSAEKKLSMHIIEEDSNAVLTHSIPGNDVIRLDQHNYLFELERPFDHWEWCWQNMALISDSRKRRYFINTTEGDHIGIYDIEGKRTIIRILQTFSPLLYVSQSDAEQAESRLYTFMSRKNIIFSCSFMLEEARTLSEPLIIDPTQNDYGKIIKFDREELFPPLLCDGLARNW